MKPNRHPPALAKWLFRVVSVALALAIALAALEVGVRAAGVRPRPISSQYIPWVRLTPRGLRLTPNSRTNVSFMISRRTVGLRVNSFGLRGPEPRPVKSVPRILFLGDSVVFGQGLAEEESIPAVLQARLGDRAEVINGGVQAMGLDDELNLLEDIGPGLRPDFVILGFYLNDADRSFILTDEYGDLPAAAVSLLTAVREKSAAADWLWLRLAVSRRLQHEPALDWLTPFQSNRWRASPEAYRGLIAAARQDYGAAWQTETWDRLAPGFDRFARVCREIDARPLAVIFPVSPQVYAAGADEYPQQRFQQAMRERGIPAYDPLPLLRREKDRTLFYDHCHYTPAGVELLAADLAAWLP